MCVCTLVHVVNKEEECLTDFNHCSFSSNNEQKDDEYKILFFSDEIFTILNNHSNF